MSALTISDLWGSSKVTYCQLCHGHFVDTAIKDDSGKSTWICPWATRLRLPSHINSCDCHWYHSKSLCSVLICQFRSAVRQLSIIVAVPICFCIWDFALRLICFPISQCGLIFFILTVSVMHNCLWASAYSSLIPWNFAQAEGTIHHIWKSVVLQLFPHFPFPLCACCPKIFTLGYLCMLPSHCSCQ